MCRGRFIREICLEGISAFYKRNSTCRRFRHTIPKASTYIEVLEKRQGIKVACLEGIAYRQGRISEERMRELAQPLIKSQYGQYLLKVMDGN